jgi:hypothetical protein
MLHIGFVVGDEHWTGKGKIKLFIVVYVLM